jgi:hypothetical protein
VVVLFAFLLSLFLPSTKDEASGFSVDTHNNNARDDGDDDGLATQITISIIRSRFFYSTATYPTLPYPILT